MDPLRARKRMMTLVAVAAPLCIFTPYFNALPPYWNVAAIIASFSLIAIMCLSWLYTICVVIAEAFPVRNVASVVGITAGFGARGRGDLQLLRRATAEHHGAVAFPRNGRPALDRRRDTLENDTP